MNNEDTVGSKAGGNANMNIRRFVAENSRAALRQVRETLGGDAIILANRSIEGGVEVLAAAPEAVDALTRRMTASTASSLPLAAHGTMPATPTELGLRASSRAEAAPAAAPTPNRKRLSSLFSRRTQAQADTSLPTIAEQFAPPRASALSKAASSYLTFADELTAAATDDEDFVTQFAPEAINAARSGAVAKPVAQEEVAPVVAARVAAATVQIEAPVVVQPAAMLAPVVAAQPAVTAAELTDAVAREVRREVKHEIERELGRDVITDMTRDVSREVSLAVSSEITRDVTNDVTREVTREIRAMQATLTEQLSTLTWTDAMRRQPGRTKLMQDLILAGFSPSLSRHIQERLPEEFAPEQAREWAQAILCRNLPVATDAEELINEGGVFALVGPTGVGKTTTVAKLAARFAMKHGIDQLALITTDGFRIGAQDQLRIYGKILGIAVHSIHDEPSLTSAIAHLKDKKLVLIDTAGMSQRDERVTEQIAMLRGAKAKRLVVLNATADAETLDHVIATFADRDFAGCVITKTDEAARLGPVLDAVIRHRLRIHHVSTGQKVPEDLERPDPAALVKLAMRRSIARPAFDLKTDDVPVWMSAMAGRATALDPALLNLAQVNTPSQTAGAVHA
jgi:flagellar biosynthesis protein FlhF